MNHTLFIIIASLIIILIVLEYNRESFELFESATATYKLKLDDKCLSNHLKSVKCDHDSTNWMINDFNQLVPENAPTKCLMNNGEVGLSASTGTCAILTGNIQDGQYINIEDGKVLVRGPQIVPTSTAMTDQIYKLSQLTLK